MQTTPATRTTLSKLAAALIAASTLCTVLVTPRMAYAQSEVSALSALSALPGGAVCGG